MLNKAFTVMPIALFSVLALCACKPMQGTNLAITGQIQGNGVDVGSRVGGRVAEVPVREGDIRHSLADLKAAHGQLGYEPTHSVALGIAEMLSLPPAPGCS